MRTEKDFFSAPSTGMAVGGETMKPEEDRGAGWPMRRQKWAVMSPVKEEFVNGEMPCHGLTRFLLAWVPRRRTRTSREGMRDILGFSRATADGRQRSLIESVIMMIMI